MLDIMTLTDDHGVDHQYRLLDTITFNEKIYCFFYPIEFGDTELLILRADENENPELSTYNFEENEEVLNKVLDMFKEKHKDDINFQI